MSKLPVIVAQGGISSAGRTSAFHGYRRLVMEKLAAQTQQETVASLRSLRGMEDDASCDEVFAGTLVRKLETNLFDASAIPLHNVVQAQAGSELLFGGRRLPDPLPAGWQLEKLEDGTVKVHVTENQSILVEATRASTVNAAGQLPSGFNPEKLYQSRNHPRSLAMTVYGASDAMLSSGMDWDAIKQKISPEQVAVYAGSAMSQLDYNGNGGMMQARLLGKRVTSKQCPLGMAQMSADFINAYLLGGLGNSGTRMGACATFLFNLEQAVSDVRAGRCRLAIVGNSEAPITPEVMEGYSTMGALATDAALRQLDGMADSDDPNYRRACRPFSTNAGFTLAESSQFIVLMDDELALECGAEILGAVGDVFVNADGFKKSISAPGAGNHLTVARAAALARAIGGEERLRNNTFVQAHGTGTPQNRVTESEILNDVARVFGINGWTVSAVKSYVGHSIATAAGDQMMATLGVWKYGYIPGITTIDHLADDVHSQYLNIAMDHIEAPHMEMALLNSKGFGGNNATGLLLSPQLTVQMLTARHGDAAMTAWRHKNEAVQAQQAAYDAAAIAGSSELIYIFGEGVLGGEDLSFTDQRIVVPGYGQPVNLNVDNPYWAF